MISENDFTSFFPSSLFLHSFEKVLWVRKYERAKWKKRILLTCTLLTAISLSSLGSRKRMKIIY